MSKLLDGITIIDFSHRLPGPYAGYLLASMGAKVLKIEDEKFKDSFLSGAFSEMDESFVHWYQELNKSKQILRFDFKSTQDQEKIKKLIDNSDGIILSLPEKIKNILGLTHNDLKMSKRNLAIIEPLASLGSKQNLHDINALADCGLLSLHIDSRNEAIVAPPFLPISGISFGHKIATDLIAAIMRASREKTAIYHSIYLFETTAELFHPFYTEADQHNKRSKFLHNGLFPCYNLYRLKDGHYAALAAVEEKFWNSFCTLLNLELDPKRRFDPSDQDLFQLLSKKFLQMDSEELSKIIKDHELCLSLVKKI